MALFAAAIDRLAQEVQRLLDDVDGLLRRESLYASFRDDERRELLRQVALDRRTGGVRRQLQKNDNVALLRVGMRKGQVVAS